ncbi:PIG-L deacetylase family protein [Tsuneonella dongtanensis]|nr:PIG-L family deacetylase [Tsuneonella dongtanensis]
MKPAVNLVVAAHPDDEILGFGATGAKLAARGETIQPVLLCGHVDARTQRPSDAELAADIVDACRTVGFAQPVLGDFPNIRLNTVPHIELVQFLETQIAAFAPDRIFTHHPGDLNDDHRQVAAACFAATRLFQRRSDLARVRSLHCMEIPSATDWSFPTLGPAFEANEYVGIDDTLDTKLAALACYRKVMRPFPHPRSEEAIRGLAAVRGAECGLGHAEAFQTVFSTWMD